MESIFGNVKVNEPPPPPTLTYCRKRIDLRLGKGVSEVGPFFIVGFRYKIGTAEVGL
jgi:hypothetical protein